MGAGWDPEMPGTNEGLTARGTKSSLFCEEHSGCGRMEAGAPGVYGGGGGVSPLLESWPLLQTSGLQHHGTPQ